MQIDEQTGTTFSRKRIERVKAIGRNQSVCVMSECSDNSSEPNFI